MTTMTARQAAIAISKTRQKMSMARCIVSALQVAQDHVAHQAAAVRDIAAPAHVALEDGGEGVLVLHVEDAHGGDRLVDIQGVDAGAKHALLLAALDDAREPLDDGAVER